MLWTFLIIFSLLAVLVWLVRRIDFK
jgi:hypothetical protein